MLIGYKEICLRVSKRLNIPVEEVIYQVELYSKVLEGAMRKLTELSYDFFYLGRQAMSRKKLHRLKPEYMDEEKIKNWEYLKVKLDTVIKYNLSTLRRVGVIWNEDGTVNFEEQETKVIKKRERAIMKYLKNNEFSTLKEIITGLNLTDKKQLRYDLKRLKKEGKLITKGATKGTKYIVKK